MASAAGPDQSLAPRMVSPALWISGLALLALSCATAPKARPETKEARIRDDVGERAASHRVASGNLRLEEEEGRWGLEAARARRTDAKQRNAGVQGDGDLRVIPDRR